MVNPETLPGNNYLGGLDPDQAFWRTFQGDPKGSFNLQLNDLKGQVSRLREQLWGGGGVGYDPDMYLGPQQGGSLFFNRLSQGTRELNPLQQERSIELAYLLYESNPMGKAIVETIRDFVLGDSCTVTSGDPDPNLREEQQRVIDRFWADPINLMSVKLSNKVLELGLFGEQCYPVELNPTDGLVRLGYLDPATISRILVDPRNVERQLAVVTLVRDVGGMPEERWYRIIDPNEDPNSDWFGRLQAISFDRLEGVDTATAFNPSSSENKDAGVGGDRNSTTVSVPDPGTDPLAVDPSNLNYIFWKDASNRWQYHKVDGSCFFFTVNKVSNATRGRTDLLSLIDWVDAFDQMLFSEVDRALLLKAFIWDVSLDGYDDKKIDDYRKANPQPRPGSVRYHNEKVTWNAVTPDLKAADASAAADLILSYIATGARLPKTWLNGMMDVNKATAQELGAPALARLSIRQQMVRFMVSHIMTLVLDQAEMKGLITRRGKIPGSIAPTPWNLHVTLPDLKQANQTAVAQAINNIVIGLAYSVQFGFIDMELARQVLTMFIQQMGITVDIQSLKERIKRSGIDPDKLPPIPIPQPGSRGQGGAVPPANQPTPNGATTSGGRARIKQSSDGRDVVEQLLEAALGDD